MRPGDQRLAAALGDLHARQGRTAAAREMMRHLERLRGEGVAVDGSLAVVHARLGNREEAWKALEAAAGAREAGLSYRLRDDRLRDVLRDPRAAALAARLGVKTVR